MSVPTPRSLFAVHHGRYAGEFFILVKETEETFEFLSTPTMQNRSVPKDKFSLGCKEGIIRLVEKLPKDVFKTVVKQFEKNDKQPK